MYKIMPLGDSITYDNDFKDGITPRPTGDRIAYRFHLNNLLCRSGIDYTFVGNRKAGFTFFDEPANAGFPGCTVKQLSEVLRSGYNGYEKKYEVKGKYLERFHPDIILLHIGTNHVDQATAEDMEDLLNLINEYACDQKRKITLFLARIIDYFPHNPAVTQFNSSVDKLLQQWRSEKVTIIRVDMESLLDPSTDMADKMHPNLDGYRKMAGAWFEAIITWRNQLSREE